MKTILHLILLLLSVVGATAANVAPTVVVKSAAMRTGTTLMDVVYCVTDPDDATVSVRALAFVDGIRSFANVIRPVTWAEGTETSLGDAITSNVDHTLTWDVAADWHIDLGHVTVEILARDTRGLLPLDWITIPATATTAELTISQNVPTDEQVMDALFCLYANDDTGLALKDGILSGSAESGVFKGIGLVDGTTPGSYATAYVFKRMDIDPAGSAEVSLAISARTGISDPNQWYATKRPYAGETILTGWGLYFYQNPLPLGLCDVAAIAAGGYHSLALKSDGTVVELYPSYSEIYIPMPDGLSGVTAIAAGFYHSLALKSDGTVVAWGDNGYGQSTIPAGLSNVIAIAAGGFHSLALKSDGTVVAWGYNDDGQRTIPAGLSNVTAISAGYYHSLALKSNGTVVAWGDTDFGQTTIPDGLSGVTAIAAGGIHSLALKSDGTVVAWGQNYFGQLDIPAGLSNVIAIAAGENHSLALKSDGTVVAWGCNENGQINVPAELSGVVAIAAGVSQSLALKGKAE